MKRAEAIKLIDETAKFYIWSDGPCGWVKGNGWETKICANEEQAWAAAEEILAGPKTEAFVTDATQTEILMKWASWAERKAKEYRAGQESTPYPSMREHYKHEADDYEEFAAEARAVLAK